MMFAVDDGIVNGNFDFADLLFAAAFICFVVLAILLGVRANTPVLNAILLPIGLALVALGWFVV